MKDLGYGNAQASEGETLRGIHSRRRFLGTGASMLAGGTLLAACGSNDSESPSGGSSGGGKPGEGKSIGVIVNGINQFSQNFASGALKALAGTGYEFIGLSADYDSTKEVDRFDTLISRGVDGIVVLPNTVQSVTRGALAAQRAGIPVVNALWTPTSADDAFVGRIILDMRNGGRLFAEYLVENADPGDVLMVTGVPGQGYSEESVEGLKGGLAELGGGKWNLAAVQPGFFDGPKSVQAAQNMMTAHPDAKVIVCVGGALDVATFLKKRGRTDVTHCGTYDEKRTEELLGEGWYTMLMYYSAAEMARVGTNLLRDHLEKDASPQEVKIDQFVVTKANVDKVFRKVPPDYLAEYSGEVEKIG